MKNDNDKIDINELKVILDRTIVFIENCDTKASVTLATIGVIATIFFSSNLVPLSFKCICDVNGETRILIIILLVLSLASVVVGIIKLISVLFARAKVSGSNSVIYFSDIAELDNCKSYTKKMQQCTYDDLYNDYSKQIYINAQICSKKHVLYNAGLVFSFSGICTLAILLTITNIVWGG